VNIARIFAYTRFLERELVRSYETIDALLDKIPGIQKHVVTAPSKPVEFKPLLRRPMARDFIRSEERKIVKEMNEPKSNIKVEAT